MAELIPVIELLDFLKVRLVAAITARKEKRRYRKAPDTCMDTIAGRFLHRDVIAAPQIQVAAWKN